MTEADRLIIQALDVYESDLCQCGHPRAQAWNPENDAADPEGKGHYETGAPFRCLACTALARSQSSYAQTHGDDHMAGAYWITELVPRGKRLT